MCCCRCYTSLVRYCYGMLGLDLEESNFESPLGNVSVLREEGEVLLTSALDLTLQVQMDPHFWASSPKVLARFFVRLFHAHVCLSVPSLITAEINTLLPFRWCVGAYHTIL